MKNIILILSLMLLPACDYDDKLAEQWYLYNLSKIHVESMDNYYFENDLEQIMKNNYHKESLNINLILEYVYREGSNFGYKYEEKEYWQSPEETYWRINIDGKMTGDCEDYSLLFMYLVKNILNFKTYLVESEHHAFVYVEDINIYFDPTEGYIVDKNTYNIQQYIPYGEAMWMAIKYHRHVGKYIDTFKINDIF